ncbi:vWA domain-containing protein [Photobacterium sanguinicancri]|uniref:VWA domain-containing protein n=1 Tax=Photobacterium sanguinicancri TaxID=875932 RepID=A0AAW7Y2K1_9GAMM|nr:VWA domain-containing protein [Photobacterium sanguinicancri]MDO6541634.1 VWA domain-containing protein [Photobacterium sanguinicancri]
MTDSLFWQQLLTAFHFIRPWWLLAFIPLAVTVYWRWQLDDASTWQQVLPKHLRDALTIGEKGWKKQLPLKVLTLLMVLAILVCAGPSWQRETSPFGEDKATMLVVMDASESMLEKDVAPSRLERAKQKVRDLLALRQGGKTGLVVYSGSAHTAMPPTQDSDVFSPFLAAIDPSIMPESGKSAEQALPLISSLLGNELAGSVLLITDGANPTTIDAFSAYFANSPHQLLVLAMGNSDVVSHQPFDLKSLNQLADSTEGKLVEVSIDASDVQTLNRYVERHMQLNNESAMPWKDMGYYVLFPITFILLLWFRKGWLVQWCLIAAVLLPVTFSAPVSAQSVHTKAAPTAEEIAAETDTVTVFDRVSAWWLDMWLTPDQQGQLYFNQQEYVKAAQHFTDPLRKGVAYYYGAEYQLAHSAFLQVGKQSPAVVSQEVGKTGSEALDNTRSAQRELGLFNAANALARQREYLAARDMFLQLAQHAQTEPIRQQADHNYQVIKGIVEEINRTSESQSGTTDGPEESFELGDNPQTAEGAEEQVSSEMMVRETLNANEILGSDELADKWLRRVEADPKYFLRAKFQLQRIEQTAAQGKLGSTTSQGGSDEPNE